ncbi:transcriptional regulator, TetR family [Corynebacterium mustelae]|uniref:Transcriptional regulator, TetR family n=1 Tax=Corynebacterium mustelae TaxID=571915 RepID=A0A0G3H1F4_9CORY|nr:TetR/AcrR family transcriptional regulator [Corynebacterium mustelae]AKK07229.1 transcriptional regulator, TetR family [Corynebacterium mustelae]
MASPSGKSKKEQILDAALELFVTKGFQEATIEDILAATGIARGTLYYHFHSKTDIMMQIIDRTAGEIAHQAQLVANEVIDFPMKFLRVVQAAQVSGPARSLVSDMHEAPNAEFHIQSVTKTVEKLAPILGDVIAEGVTAGSCSSPQPLRDAEILLTAGFILPDHGFFPASVELSSARLMGLFVAAERLLQLSSGTLTAFLVKDDHVATNSHR